MQKFFNKLEKILIEISKKTVGLIIFLLTLYALLPILSPIALKYGAPEIGRSIQKVYRIFCHQAVERSAFLFAEGVEDENGDYILEPGLVKFYSVDELKEVGYIPKESYNSDGPWSFNHLGYPYWGNEQLGYKVAYCIRDTALYTALAITMILASIILKVKNIKAEKIKIPIWIYGVLLLPMAADGVFQTIVEYLKFDFVPQTYVDNIPKRIITGALFGVGFGLFIYVSLKKSVEMLYNQVDEEK